MAIRQGTTSLTGIYMGATEVQKVYQGTDLIYSAAAPLDPDAQAFLTATGITDATETSAINQLVLDMKGAGVWTKVQAAYPLVGGTATTQKYNLMDPQDTDAAFRLTWNGTWIHNSDGIKGDGSTTTAVTNWNPAANVTSSTGCHLVLTTNVAKTNGQYDMAGAQSGFGDWGIIVGYLGNNNGYANTGSGWLTGTLGATPNAYVGTMAMSHDGTSTLTSFWPDGTQLAQSTSHTFNLPTYDIPIGGADINGTLERWANAGYSFSSLGEYLTNSQMADYTTAIDTYNTALSR